MMPDFVHSFSPGYPTMFYLSMGQRFPFLLYLFSCLTLFPGALLMGQSEHSADYLTYHSSVNQAENQLSEGQFPGSPNYIHSDLRYLSLCFWAGG